jgi:hypothetical protein
MRLYNNIAWPLSRKSDRRALELTALKGKDLQAAIKRRLDEEGWLKKVGLTRETTPSAR